MNIAIIDADLIGRKKHRFPNLACMKLSGYFKSQGNQVSLELDYKNINNYDKVYISKVFTDTPIQSAILGGENIEYGGTGFYYDKAPALENSIEHFYPDYSLYSQWAANHTDNTEYYLDYSLGYLTRHCFRGCYFCVNKNYKKVDFHANLEEFYNPEKKGICLLDDNFLGYKDWKKALLSLQDTKKTLEFRQGLDMRAMTDEKAELLNASRYNGDYIFAFDNIQDKMLIERKLKTWRSHCRKNTKMYVFCGFENTIQDVVDTFERIKVLMKYGCYVYIMRHENYKNSKYAGTYKNLARWCNQPSFYKKMSYGQFCKANDFYNKCTTRYARVLEVDYPEILKYYDFSYDQLNEYSI